MANVIQFNRDTGKAKSDLEKHKAYVARWKKNGGRTMTVTMPCCHGVIEFHAPSDDSQWDSLTLCPHCQRRLFKKVTCSSLWLEVLHD